MNDDQLHRLLREAPSEVPVPDSFGREVWARIELEDSRSFTGSVRLVLEPFFAWLAKPVPALATVAACLMLGFFFGVSAARTDLRPDGEALNELGYVRSINPLAHHDIKEKS